MGGRGPAPKPNALHPARGVRLRYTLAAGDPWPVPEGEWHPKAVRWWQRMTSCPTAAVWDSDADVEQVERGLAHAHRFWCAFDAGDPIDKIEAVLMRIETTLWLSRTERARQGIQADMNPQQPSSAQVVSASRERLRAIDAVG